MLGEIDIEDMGMGKGFFHTGNGFGGVQNIIMNIVDKSGGGIEKKIFFFLMKAKDIINKIHPGTGIHF